MGGGAPPATEYSDVEFSPPAPDNRFSLLFTHAPVCQCGVDEEDIVLTLNVRESW